MNINQVVLVDEQDNILGEMDKLEAHQKGVLHRAFSIFVFDNEGRMLVHQRALSKYHSAGLWTNACCSHPCKGETYLAGAHRRIQQEMGFDLTLYPVKSIIYKSKLADGLWEHELDQLFVGRYNGPMQPNPDEVSAHTYISLETLQAQMIAEPDTFTEWFKVFMQPDHLRDILTTLKNEVPSD
ncbi:isopentenyl-diphosphate Delta-isomerase [Vibrio sp. WXL103]|uniref:isopentenyl-diphosphate Delta-isomerase n=1 Tax=unclassified Vibrio TaxID=2614977 RepID=UPI003EC713FD